MATDTITSDVLPVVNTDGSITFEYDSAIVRGTITCETVIRYARVALSDGRTVVVTLPEVIASAPTT